MSGERKSASWFIGAHLLSVSSHGVRGRRAFWGHKSSDLINNNLPKAPTPNAITLGVRISSYEWGKGRKYSVQCNMYVCTQMYRFGVLCFVSVTFKAYVFPSGFSSL